MQLCAAVVVFAATLPHAIVGHPVGSLHTEHQILDEGNLQGKKNNKSKTSKTGYREGYKTTHYIYTVHMQIEPELLVVNRFPNGNPKKIIKTKDSSAPTLMQTHMGHKGTKIHGYTIMNDL